MVTRLTRLVGLLGRRLDNVDYDCITALVGNSEAAESEDLDYKRSHYATDDKGREELAKDVAAFANHTGGLLILGMAENKGVPSMVFDVDLDDTHLRRIRQTIANNTAPPVSYEPIPVPNPSSPNAGFLLLAVPRSPYGPHAVTAPPTKPSRDSLRYPLRGGSTTEWLTETDVSTAYRARFTSAAERDQRLADIEEDVVGALVRRTTPHLIVTVVPEQAGDMVIDSDRFARYKEELLATELLLGQGVRNFGRVTVGPRRLIVTEGGSRYSARAELHATAAPPSPFPWPGSSRWTTTTPRSCTRRNLATSCTRCCARSRSWQPTRGTGQPPAVLHTLASPWSQTWPPTRPRPGSWTLTGRASCPSAWTGSIRHQDGGLLSRRSRATTPPPTPASSWTTSPTSTAVSSRPPQHSRTSSCRPTATPRPASSPAPAISSPPCSHTGTPGP